MQMIERDHEDENQYHHQEKKGDSNGHAVTPIEILQEKWRRSLSAGYYKHPVTFTHNAQQSEEDDNGKWEESYESVGMDVWVPVLKDLHQ